MIKTLTFNSSSFSIYNKKIVKNMLPNNIIRDYDLEFFVADLKIIKDLVIYQSESKNVKIEVLYDDENFWLT